MARGIIRHVVDLDGDGARDNGLTAGFTLRLDDGAAESFFLPQSLLAQAADVFTVLAGQCQRARERADPSYHTPGSVERAVLKNITRWEIGFEPDGGRVVIGGHHVDGTITRLGLPATDIPTLVSSLNKLLAALRRRQRPPH